LEQLQFNNTRMKDVVDNILMGSDNPPIIVIQGDHGSAFEGQEFKQEVVEERYPIFNAIYLPVGCEDLLYPSVSPVNTFRLLFNNYFGTNIEMLNGDSYYIYGEFSNMEYFDVSELPTFLEAI